MSQCVSTIEICTSSITVAQITNRSASDTTSFVQAKTVYGNRIEEPTTFIEHNEYLKQKRIQIQLTSGKFGPGNS